MVSWILVSPKFWYTFKIKGTVNYCKRVWGYLHIKNKKYEMEHDMGAKDFMEYEYWTKGIIPHMYFN